MTLESPSPASPAAHTRRRVLRPRIYVPPLLVGAVACATVPITGRSQLILISEQAALAAADEHFAAAELANAQRKGLIADRDGLAGRRAGDGACAAGERSDH